MPDTFRKVVRWIEQDHDGLWCVREINYGRQIAWAHHDQPTMSIGTGHVYTPVRSSKLEGAVAFLRQFDKTPLQGG